MRLGIDASNIRLGGGVTHLAEMLAVAEPHECGFGKVIVWSGQQTLSRLPVRPWLTKVHDPALDKGILARLQWQIERLSALARSVCHVLFVPGGNYLGKFRPYVAMSQNLLPFELHEAARFGLSGMLFRFLLLRFGQQRSFRRADGIIFLSQYARQRVVVASDCGEKRMQVIPHGISERFFLKPRPQRPLADLSYDRPFRILYVSIINVYKHQWLVAEAVAALRSTGFPVCIDFVGPAYGPAERRLKEAIIRLDPESKFLFYRGPIDFSELHAAYHVAEAFVFSSSCENLPNIIIEAMAAGLPIAASNRGPMPEVLGESAVFFNPERPDEIENCLRILLEHPQLRQRLADEGYEKAHRYTWKRCAEETFRFLSEVAQNWVTNDRDR